MCTHTCTHAHVRVHTHTHRVGKQCAVIGNRARPVWVPVSGQGGATAATVELHLPLLSWGRYWAIGVVVCEEDRIQFWSRDYLAVSKRNLTWKT